MASPIAIVGSRINHLRRRADLKYSLILRGLNSTLIRVLLSPTNFSLSHLSTNYRSNLNIDKLKFVGHSLQRGQSFARLVGFRKIRFLAQAQGTLDFAARSRLVTSGGQCHAQMEMISRRWRAVTSACRLFIDRHRLLQLFSGGAIQTFLVVDPAQRIDEAWHSGTCLH